MDRQRIDKWLWHARVVRTRSAAAALVDAGHARINGARIEASSRQVRAGDVVLELAGERVFGTADLFRKLWRHGPAGVAVPLTLARNGEHVRVLARSVDRNDLFAKPRLH